MLSGGGLWLCMLPLGVLIVLVSVSWHNFYVFWVLVYCVVSLLFAVRFVGLFWFIVCCC